jgi:serine protease AprX
MRSRKLRLDSPAARAALIALVALGTAMGAGAATRCPGGHACGEPAPQPGKTDRGIGNGGQTGNGGQGGNGGRTGTGGSTSTESTPTETDENSTGGGEEAPQTPSGGGSEQSGRSADPTVGAAAATAPARRPAPAKLDEPLAAVAQEAQRHDPHALLDVIVFGRGLRGAIDAADATPRRVLAGLGAESVTLEAADLDVLAASNAVSFVTLDSPVLPTAAPDRGAAARLATLYPSVDGASRAWRTGLTGKGVGVAVIDSGVTAAPDFGARRLVRVRLPGQAGGLDDAYGHGTFVAGVVGGSSGDGRYVGVAPGARIFALDIARPDGVYTSDVIAGLGWVLTHHRRYGIRVVALSLSEIRPSSYRASPLDTAVEQLWRSGVVVVASAGNLGPGSAYFAPGNDPRAITVGALDVADTTATNDDRVASFSSSGTTVDGFPKPELLAPGRHIVSVLPAGSALFREAPAENLVAPGHAMMSGTSFSAPQVAGAAAILLQQNPRLTPDQVKWLLARTARPVGGSAAGALDLGRALGFRGKARSAAAPPFARFGARGATTAAFRKLAGGGADLPEAPAGASSSGWNAAAWNAAAWNAAAWNAAAWNAAAWNAAAWN